MGEVQEVIVPKEHLQDRKLVLTWDSPTDEDHLNWRLHSRQLPPDSLTQAGT